MFVQTYGPRPDREMQVEVIRRPKVDDLAALIAERRARVARLNAGEL